MLKVLIVDDEGRQLDSLFELLRRNFDVIRAGPNNPVRDAIEQWNRFPDLRLAIVDLKMPLEQAGREKSDESVGFGLIKQLKDLRPDARVAVRSGYQTHDNLAQSIRLGADAFMGKDWRRDDTLANVHFLWSWVTAASAIRTLTRSMHFRDPFMHGHSTRVREYCRNLVLEYMDATPATFDLAACMAAAELHDIGMLDIPDERSYGVESEMSFEDRRVIERHIDAAHFLADLGPGFEKVAEIVRQHRRWYREPAIADAIDYPKDEAVPRADKMLMEARVLAVANAIDILAADRPFRSGLSIESLRAAIAELGRKGAFDPKLVTAFERLGRNDPASIEKIYQTGRIPDQARLRVRFAHTQHLTMRRLKFLLTDLERVVLVTGRAVDRLSVAGVECQESEKSGVHEVTITFVGWPSDVAEAREILMKRMQEASSWRNRSELPEMLQRALGTIPTRVE